MDLQLPQNLYNETSSSDDEYYLSDNSEDEDGILEKNSPNKSSGLSEKLPAMKDCEKDYKNQNILLKLMNRERTGFFSGCWRTKINQHAFNKVPTRLSFCLKDIVPYCYLQGHMFMGLTTCGQFLLSYKVCYDEGSFATAYNFSSYYKYTLYFWIYRPHQPLGKYIKVCLFDDHGVDNLKVVTMTQWMSNPRLLIVHGSSEYENEDSYITIVRVPKLGCLECKELRDIDSDGYFRCDALCIKCNLTIHTKYSTTESDPRFNPHVNLICPERIILIANGFIHMLHVELEINNQQQSPQHQQQQSTSSQQQQSQQNGQVVQSSLFRQNLHTLELSSLSKCEKTVTDFSQDDRKMLPSSTEIGCDNKNNIVARIIADFSDCDNETQASIDKIGRSTDGRNKNYNELIFTCGSSTATTSNNINSSLTKTSSNTGSIQSKVSLLNHSGRKNHRIVTKSYKNGVTTVDLQASSSTDKASAYEFSEDNEKCEKIGTFRKRRLADKKYEFSEDNSENIIPFTKARRSIQTRTSRIPFPHGSSHHQTIFVSASSSQSYETTNHLHRASPSQGFRSPCGSPVGSSRFMRSPTSRANQPLSQKSTPPLSPSSNQPQQINTAKPLNTLSPRQISAAKRTYFEHGNVSPTYPFLSPRRDDPIQSKTYEISSGISGDNPDKPVCTKKFKRRFVEEDDAASVITSEEDDCISPGYHTSLPMEVHGSCYSDMQMISQISYQKLKCPTVIVTQHSFDLETFTYHVINNLCQTNNKSYDVFYDWACELINVCPNSNSISCILMAHFTARDQLPNSTNKCVNCSRNIDCVYHRKRFECRILFTWNMDTGDWDVLNYGELREVPTSTANKTSCGLTKVAKTLADDIASNLNNVHSFSYNLRVLDSNVDKSKNSLIDLHNSIEFYRKRGRLLNNTECSD